MKKISVSLLALLFAVTAFATIHHPVVNPGFNWVATTHDFGKIPKGTPVTHTFRFTNNGSAPLVISSVQASCGCTIAEYSNEPIEAGAEGYVKATYNAANVGAFTKTVTVNANTEDGVVQLFVKGEVTE